MATKSSAQEQPTNINQPSTESAKRSSDPPTSWRVKLIQKLSFFTNLFKSQIMLGYLCLGAVIVQWVTSGFVAQYVYESLDYRCTIAQSVYTLCFYSLLLVPHLYRAKGESSLLALKGPLKFVWETKFKVFLLGCLWLGAQIIYVMSLLYTSMGTNTAVSSSSSAFSFIFSMILLGYSFRLFSAVGVLITIGGVVLTALFRAETITAVPVDQTTPPSFVVTETVEGIVMAVSAAACFGLFSCLFKKWITCDDYGGIVFGSFGLISFIVGIPLVVIAHFSHLQTFLLPSWKVMLTVTGDAVLCCFVNNFCLSRAFIYLTPVIVLVGLTMTVPLSIFVDAVIFSNHAYSKLNIVGISMITVAVLIVGYDQTKFELQLAELQENKVKYEKELAQQMINEGNDQNKLNETATSDSQDPVVQTSLSPTSSAALSSSNSEPKYLKE